MIPKWIAEFVLTLALGIIESMKPKPEEIERMSNNAKVRAMASFISAGYPGYELPDSAKQDRWGTPKAPT